jgi:hypothetical protein
MAQNFSAYPALLGFNLLDSPDSVVRSCCGASYARNVSVSGLQAFLWQLHAPAATTMILEARRLL